jgi:hypothetical protein
MLKPISKIALILVFTFLSGLVMTDCILPEIQSEERAEIEIEEEREIESIEHIESILVSKTIVDEAGKKINTNQIQQIAINNQINLSFINCQFKLINGYSISFLTLKKLPKYILFSSLKLFS